ncbi:MAG: class I SAM-dependent methyltransferase [Verrucomicrobiota bacterium]
MKRLLAAWKTQRFMRREYENLPEGWLSKYQARTLYYHGLTHSGPMLEIGSWVGRSTCCIAAGIRDSGQAKELTAVDLGISSREEWRDFFGRDLANKPNEELYARHIEREGGPMASLRENLESRGLEQYVKVRKGDFLDLDLGRDFSLIFADVTHSEREINRNVPRLVSLLRPRGILLADDIRNPDLLGCLLGHFPSSDYSLREQLFIGVKSA